MAGLETLPIQRTNIQVIRTPPLSSLSGTLKRIPPSVHTKLDDVRRELAARNLHTLPIAQHSGDHQSRIIAACIQRYDTDPLQGEGAEERALPQPWRQT
jgi:hypothetical protein